MNVMKNNHVENGIHPDKSHLHKKISASINESNSNVVDDVKDDVGNDIHTHLRSLLYHRG